MAMVSNQIPYRVYGGLRFFERAEIKHTLAYLRLISNKNDDNAFIRIVNFPPRGIGARSIEQLDDYAKRNDCSMWEAAKIFSSENKSPKISIFVSLIQTLEDQIYGNGIDESIDSINTYFGLKEHYAKDKDGGSRIENLDELVSAAKSYMIDSREENPEHVLTENQSLALAEFLDYTSLESGELQTSAGDDALQLMTIHSSKGLEFDVVFITGLEDGLCPHERSLLEQKGIEEERRLMYVAVTRARNKLYLSLAQSRMTYGQPRYNLPSRFLDEIPEELIKRLNSSKDKDLLYRAPQIAAYSESRHVWKVGTMVSHQKFGQGMITGYEGNENDLRIQIKFSDHGIKWLAMEYAKLTEA